MGKSELIAEMSTIYETIHRKEFQLLHYNKYSLTLLFFEKYLENENLLDDAFKKLNLDSKSHLNTKAKFKDFDRNYQDINNELIYKAYYQMLEEYIADIYRVLFTTYPIFLYKENSQFELDYESLFMASNIIDTQNALIERKVKAIIQSNNILNILKKLNKLFQLDLVFAEEDLKQLFLASTNRNILTHNNGLVNRIYLQELKNQKISTSYKLGDSIIKDLDNSIDIIRDIVFKIVKSMHESILNNLFKLDNYSQNLEKITELIIYSFPKPDKYLPSTLLLLTYIISCGAASSDICNRNSA